MSKFVAENVYTMTNEKGNLVVCYEVHPDYRRSGLMAVEETRGGKIEVDCKVYKSKRSLEQNRLLWALLSKMAVAMSGNKRKIEVDDCYRLMLEETNAESTFVLTVPEAEKELKQVYRVVKEVGERTVNGKVLKMYQCYLGSSKFNTAQMTELIEAVLDRLAEMGIYDSEIETALNEYGKK